MRRVNADPGEIPVLLELLVPLVRGDLLETEDSLVLMDYRDLRVPLEIVEHLVYLAPKERLVTPVVVENLVCQVPGV